MPNEWMRGFMTGGKLSSIWVANKDIIYWSVQTSSKRGGNGVKGGVWGVILASCKFNFFLEYNVNKSGVSSQ